MLVQDRLNAAAFDLGAVSLELSTSLGLARWKLSLSLAPELQLPRSCELLPSLRNWTGASVSQYCTTVDATFFGALTPHVEVITITADRI